jgi:hypothetical protein
MARGEGPVLEAGEEEDVVWDGTDDSGIVAGYSAPSSSGSPFSRPPTRDLASMTNTSYPRCRSSLAHARPDTPAPNTISRVGRRRRRPVVPWGIEDGTTSDTIAGDGGEGLRVEDRRFPMALPCVCVYIYIYVFGNEKIFSGRRRLFPHYCFVGVMKTTNVGENRVDENSKYTSSSVCVIWTVSERGIDDIALLDPCQNHWVQCKIII